MAPEEMDMDNKSHFAKVRYGRLILLFESRIAEHVSRPAASDSRCLAFVEELWEYTPSESDIDPIRTEFGCKRLYRTDPEPTYYVLDVWRILGDAPIIADPINPTIPFKALKYNGPARSNLTRAPGRTPVRRSMMEVHSSSSTSGCLIAHTQLQVVMAH